MSIRLSVLVIILGTAAVTFLLRVLPLILLSRIKLSKSVIRWLSYIPIAVLSALLAQSVLLTNEHLTLSIHNLYLMATIPTLFTAILTRNLLLTVITGVLVMAILRMVFV